MNKQEMIEANRKAGKQIFTVGDMAKAVKRDTVTPKINDKFRFDDGTIGTIVQVVIYENGSTRYKVRMPFIQVLTPNHILKYQTFPISDLTLYQAPVTSNAIWTVKG